MRVSKFNPDTSSEQPTVTADELIAKMKAGDAYTFGVTNLLQSGVFRLSGYAFDIRDELTRYIYKQNYQWQEAYAPNKTTLRKLVYGRIDEILEAK